MQLRTVLKSLYNIIVYVLNRFEEPDSDFIRKYPRVIEGSLRQKDQRNKKERERKKMREIQETERKQQEIKRLKALQKKEVLEKIECLKKVAGISEHRDMNFEVCYIHFCKCFMTTVPLV